LPTIWIRFSGNFSGKMRLRLWLLWYRIRESVMKTIAVLLPLTIALYTLCRYLKEGR